MLYAEDSIKSSDFKNYSDDKNFENAMLLYNLKMFNKALIYFSEYLEIYYNGSHRKEAYKKIASIYFEQKNYLRAVKTYKSLIEEFSDSLVGAEASYYIGICYFKMGFYDKSKGILKSVIQKYSGSYYANLSRTKLDFLNIIGK